jgi:phytoene/squalene synthetase
MVADAMRSHQLWGHYRSTHEAYGVIREELDEMFDAIRADDDEQARAEAIQVAACAFRFALDGWVRPA